MDGKRLIFLCIILVVYICIGAGLFMATEHWREKEKRASLQKLYNEFLANYTCVPQSVVNKFIYTIDHARREGIRLVEDSMGPYMWDFASSLCFCITLITTIGYGDIVPVTDIGKCVTVPYALIGIPLCLIVLGGIGESVSKLSGKISGIKMTKHATVNKLIMTVVLIVIGVSFLFVIPALVLMFVEGWSFLICLYYCFVTLTTIGFGDYVPGVGKFPAKGWQRDFYKIAIYVWILMGLAYLSLVIQILVHVISKRAEQVRRKAAETVVDFKKVSMKFTKRKSRSDLSVIETNDNGIVNNALSFEGDEDDEDGRYEDLCDKCRQILLDMEHNVKLVRISSLKDGHESTIENGEVVVFADEHL